jgi:hypothetical protein
MTIPMDTNEQMEMRREGARQLVEMNKQLFSDKYYLAIRTPQWKEYSRTVLRDRHYTCECRVGCLNKATEVHHLTYKLGLLAPTWAVKAVCRECHIEITRGWWGWFPFLPANANEPVAANDAQPAQPLEEVATAG